MGEEKVFGKYQPLQPHRLKMARMVNTFTTLTTALPLVFSHLLLFLSLFSSLSLPFSLIFQYSPLYLPPLYHFLSCLPSSFPPYYSYSTHKSFLSFFPLHPVSPFSLPPLSPFLFFSLLPILYRVSLTRDLSCRHTYIASSSWFSWEEEISRFVAGGRYYLLISRLIL